MEELAITCDLAVAKPLHLLLDIFILCHLSNTIKGSQAPNSGRVASTI
jgi:hypothetical protein